jgi:hypothetical protein
VGNRPASSVTVRIATSSASGLRPAAALRIWLRLGHGASASARTAPAACRGNSRRAGDQMRS